MTLLYCVVAFEEGATAVVRCEDIECRRRDKLTAKVWDFSEPVTVEWPLSFDPMRRRPYKKSDGEQKRFTAKIVTFGKHLDLMKQALDLYAKGKKIPRTMTEVEDEVDKMFDVDNDNKHSHASRSTRKRQRSRSRSPPPVLKNEAEESRRMELSSKKMKKAARTKENEKCKKLLEIESGSDNSADTVILSSESESSEREVEKSLGQKPLPKLLTLQKKKSPKKKVSQKRKSPLKKGRSTPQITSPTRKSPRKSPSKLVCTPETDSKSPRRRIVKGTVSFPLEDGQVDLGFGVKMKVDDFYEIPTNELEKTVYKTTEKLFPTEVLLTSSVTGKKSNAHPQKPAKTQLDTAKMNALRRLTTKLWPATPEKKINNLVGKKINIVVKVEKYKVKAKMEVEVESESD